MDRIRVEGQDRSGDRVRRFGLEDLGSSVFVRRIVRVEEVEALEHVAGAQIQDEGLACIAVVAQPVIPGGRIVELGSRPLAVEAVANRGAKWAPIS